jgi:hypothetical protein
LQFAGARRPGDRWPPGAYTGSVTVERAGFDPIILERTLELR